MAFFMCAWLTPPAFVENWQFGAWGEEATARALQPLERDGWVVWHDLTAGRGNVDHVAVGPGGIFLMGSKRLRGVVNVDGSAVTVTRLDDPDLSYEFTGSRHVQGLALQAHSRLATGSKIQQCVQPGVVFWCDFPKGLVEDQRCTYVHGDALAEWMAGQPQRIAPSRVTHLAEALRASWEDAEKQLT
ncbi:NERD domain-containing protein [Jatrophihabitans telluris]|uniref:NERD domain-containing protein n=1 Tax=Jatrophihabitans telluris TaxID=2038343 RepID=A0ABY4R000_9ACTN|nr:nuclease-related domain-containing protein [Jatrophihabitans telluris]UQX88817.1 NERD domain-containing protein [Jatrophihabitans telluris]